MKNLSLHFYLALCKLVYLFFSPSCLSTSFRKSSTSMYECVFSFYKIFLTISFSPAHTSHAYNFVTIVTNVIIILFSIFPILQKCWPCQHENDHPHSTPLSKTLSITFFFISYPFFYYFLFLIFLLSINFFLFYSFFLILMLINF